jgi:hypothetical protein
MPLLEANKSDKYMKNVNQECQSSYYYHYHVNFC